MATTTNIYLHLGSNIGDRLANLTAAKEQLQAQVGELLEASSTYETEPWGNAAQAHYYNQVLCMKTTWEPAILLQKMLDIEQKLGRFRQEGQRYEARTIDIDLLFYGKKIIDEPNLQVPHPRLHLRNCVLVPLMELAGNLMHPQLELTIDELYLASQDDLEVILLDY